MGTASEPEDEILDVGHAPGRHRGWWSLAFVLVAAVVLVGVVLSRHGSSPRAAGSTSASITSPAPTHSPSFSISWSHPQPPCGCVVRTNVSPALAAVLRKHLGADAELHLRTVLVVATGQQPGRLVRRDVYAYVRSATVLIRVDRPDRTGGALAPDPPGVGSILLDDARAGFRIRLQYLAPETVPPQLGQLNALMREPLLTAA